MRHSAQRVYWTFPRQVVSLTRRFPNRAFPRHRFNTQIRQGIQKFEACNVWCWVVILVTGPAALTVWLLSMQCLNTWVVILRTSENWSSCYQSRTFPLKSRFATAFMHVCICGICDYWSTETETITSIMPRQHKINWMLKLRMTPESTWTCVDLNASVEKLKYCRFV